MSPFAYKGKQAVVFFADRIEFVPPCRSIYVEILQLSVDKVGALRKLGTNRLWVMTGTLTQIGGERRGCSSLLTAA